MDEQVLLSLSMEEIYRVFMAKARDLKDEELITDEDIKKARYGIKIKFSLSVYFRYKDSENCGLFNIKPKSEKIYLGNKEYVNLREFDEELDERQGIMLNALLDYYAKDDDIVEGDYGNLIKKR